MTFQSFASAVITEERIRQEVQKQLRFATAGGLGQSAFNKAINTYFDKAGLTRLNPYQLETIFQTNTSMAFGAAQQYQLITHSDTFPYWQYSAVMDGATRPAHADLDGKIFRSDDLDFYPPISYNCRCTAIPLTAAEAKGKTIINTEIASASNIQQTEFIGNKHKNFLNWVKANYPTNAQSRKLMDIAVDRLSQKLAAKKQKATSLRKQLTSDFKVQMHPLIGERIKLAHPQESYHIAISNSTIRNLAHKLASTPNWQKIRNEVAINFKRLDKTYLAYSADNKNKYLGVIRWDYFLIRYKGQDFKAVIKVLETKEYILHDIQRIIP